MTLTDRVRHILQMPPVPEHTRYWLAGPLALLAVGCILLIPRLQAAGVVPERAILDSAGAVSLDVADADTTASDEGQLDPTTGDMPSADGDPNARVAKPTGDTEQQVLLDIAFAEVPRAAMEKLGLRAPATRRGDPWRPGTAAIDLSPKRLAQEKGVRILSQPTVLGLNGRGSSVLGGVWLPVPSLNHDGTITVVYASLGAQFDITPAVQPGGGIELGMQVKVTCPGLRSLSEITPGLANVPRIYDRSSPLVVRVKDRQTAAIWNLFPAEMRQAATILPNLKDARVLGSLVNSEQFRAGQALLTIEAAAAETRPAERGEVSK